jgi:hypothetical protein
MAVQGHDPAALRKAAAALKVTAAGFAAASATCFATAAALAVCPGASAPWIAKGKMFATMASTTFGLAMAAETKATQQEQASLASGFAPPDIRIPPMTLPPGSGAPGGDGPAGRPVVGGVGVGGTGPWNGTGTLPSLSDRGPLVADGSSPGSVSGSGLGGLNDGTPDSAGNALADAVPAGLDAADAAAVGTSKGPGAVEGALGLAGSAAARGLAIAGVVGAGFAAAGALSANRRGTQPDDDDEDEKRNQDQVTAGDVAGQADAVAGRPGAG